MLNMNATEIDDCMAEKYVGGVYLQQDSYSIIDGSRFICNSATFGGALFQEELLWQLQGVLLKLK